MKPERSREWLSLPDSQKKIILSHQQELPIKVGAIAKELGIVVKKSTLPAGISGEIKETDNICIIRINRHDVKERQRFTVAHEIAHFLLHKDKLQEGITDSILYRSGLTNALEAQANRLAADIVMPLPLIQKSMLQYRGLKIEQKIEKLAEEADMSTTAMQIRLEKR